MILFYFFKFCLSVEMHNFRPLPDLQAEEPAKPQVDQTPIDLTVMFIYLI